MKPETKVKVIVAKTNAKLFLRKYGVYVGIIGGALLAEGLRAVYNRVNPEYYGGLEIAYDKDENSIAPDRRFLIACDVARKFGKKGYDERVYHFDEKSYWTLVHDMVNSLGEHGTDEEPDK